MAEATPAPARGLGRFVTGSCANDDVDGMSSAFRAGFSEGLGLYGKSMADVRVVPSTNSDVVLVCLGPAARITISGLEMLQADDLYVAGKARALELIGLLSV